MADETAKKDPQGIATLIGVKKSDGETKMVELTDEGEVIVATSNLDNPVIVSYATAAVNIAAGANREVVATPGANKQIWVYGYSLSISATGTISIQDEDDTAITGIMPVLSDQDISVSPSGNFSMPAFKVATNKALEIDADTGDVDGWLSYAIVDVS